jgi:hypothetical protein
VSSRKYSASQGASLFRPSNESRLRAGGIAGICPHHENDLLLRGGPNGRAKDNRPL